MFSIRLPASTTGKTVEYGLGACTSVAHVGNPDEASGYCGNLGNEPGDV